MKLLDKRKLKKLGIRTIFSFSGKNDIFLKEFFCTYLNCTCKKLNKLFIILYNSNRCKKTRHILNKNLYKQFINTNIFINYI